MGSKNFGKLLMAVNGNGRYLPSHFRSWAKRYRREIGFGGAPQVAEWLEGLADALEEIYTEAIARYEEEA